MGSAGPVQGKDGGRNGGRVEAGTDFCVSIAAKHPLGAVLGGVCVCI